MHTLPQLFEEDLTALNGVMGELISQTEATTVVLTDRAGFRITEKGDLERFDTTSLGALASGSFLANQEIARMIGENDFNSCYQQGEHASMFICNVGTWGVLIAIFPAMVSAGLVKHYSIQAGFNLAKFLQLAYERAPQAGMDLSLLNIAESTQIFIQRH